MDVRAVDAPGAAGEVVSKKRLRELQGRSDGTAFVYFASHLAALGITGLLLHSALGTLFVVPAIILHGLAVVFLFAPLHECSHGTAFRTRWLNRAVGAVCGAVLLRPQLYFWYRHLAHHTYTQDARRDPDLVPMPGSLRQYLVLLLGLPFWGKVVGTLARTAAGRLSEYERSFIPPPETARVVREARVLCALYLGIGVGALAAGSWAPLLYWLLPRIVAEPALRFVRMAEHTGRPEGPQGLTDTRTMLTTRPMRALYWNMPYHAEHHFAPSVPFHALPTLHHEIRPRLRALVPGYFAVHRELLAELRRRRPYLGTADERRHDQWM